MTSESTGSSKTFGADAGNLETKKQYHPHIFDDEDMQKMKHYFKLEEESDHHDMLLRYLKQRRVRTDMPFDNI